MSSAKNSTNAASSKNAANVTTAKSSTNRAHDLNELQRSQNARRNRPSNRPSPRMILLALGVGALSFTLTLSGCGPKAFTKGQYDDPTRVELLDDKYNEADMQQMADTIVQSMVSCKWVANAPQPPIVIVERVQNRTEEHIDTVSLTDKIRTALIKSGKVRFVNKAEREILEEEYQYNESGAVSGPTQKRRGRQIGADYMMSGALATNVQQVGNDKFIYYKLTMNLTNLETSTIDCVEEKEIRKKFRKRSIGL